MQTSTRGHWICSGPRAPPNASAAKPHYRERPGRCCVIKTLSLSLLPIVPWLATPSQHHHSACSVLFFFILSVFLLRLIRWPGTKTAVQRMDVCLACHCILFFPHDTTPYRECGHTQTKPRKLYPGGRRAEAAAQPSSYMWGGPRVRRARPRPAHRVQPPDHQPANPGHGAAPHC